MKHAENGKFPRSVERQLKEKRTLVVFRAKPAGFEFLSAKLLGFDLVSSLGFGFLNLDDDSHRSRGCHKTGSQGQKNGGNPGDCDSEHNTNASLEIFR